MKNAILFILLCASIFISDINAYCIDILVENKEAKPGETVEVKIYIATYDKQVSAFGLNFNYEYKNLSFVVDSNSRCDLTQNFALIRGNEIEGGTVVICGIEASNPIGVETIGCFLSITLNVRDDAVAGVYPLTIDTLVDNIEGAIVINGSFTITAPPNTKLVDIYSNGNIFTTGDTLRIGVKVINTSDDILNMFAALMVGDTFFFYPEWNKNPFATQIDNGIWDESIAVIPVPQNPPVGTYNFIAAITDIQVKHVLGVDSVIIELK